MFIEQGHTKTERWRKHRTPNVFASEASNIEHPTPNWRRTEHSTFDVGLFSVARLLDPPSKARIPPRNDPDLRPLISEILPDAISLPNKRNCW